MIIVVKSKQNPKKTEGTAYSFRGKPPCHLNFGV